MMASMTPSLRLVIGIAIANAIELARANPIAIAIAIAMIAIDKRECDCNVAVLASRLVVLVVDGHNISEIFKNNKSI